MMRPLNHRSLGGAMGPLPSIRLGSNSGCRSGSSDTLRESRVWSDKALAYLRDGALPYRVVTSYSGARHARRIISPSPAGLANARGESQRAVRTTIATMRRRPGRHQIHAALRTLPRPVLPDFRVHGTCIDHTISRRGAVDRRRNNTHATLCNRSLNGSARARTPRLPSTLRLQVRRQRSPPDLRAR